MTQDIPDAILEQAADWLLRLNESGDDPRLRHDLAQWRAADPLHDAAWRLAALSWEDAAPRSAPATPPRRMTTPPRTRRRIAWAVAACVAGLAVLPLSPWPWSGGPATATGEVRAVTLEDGSRVVLGAATALDVDFAGDRRRVALRHGEAFFQVTPDSTRPFVIEGKGMTVTVTGTAFNVLVGAQTASVAVAEGTVSVAYAGTETHLTPGREAIVDLTSGVISPRAVAPDAVAAWRQGQLVVANQPLSEVVDILRRHHTGLIVLTDDALGARRVTGVYDLSDPVRALRAVGGPYGARVVQITPFLVVVSAG